jgi:hypothetical protein
MPIDLPGNEHTVSAVTLDGEVLFVRFISDFFAGDEGDAFELIATNLIDADAVCTYLYRAKQTNEYLFAFERNSIVVLSDESGNEIELRANSIRCKLDEPNTEELRRFLARSRENYEQEFEASRAAYAKLTRVQQLVCEQIRRLELKSASHKEGSTAAVLYAQHVQFLHRILDATEDS